MLSHSKEVESHMLTDPPSFPLIFLPHCPSPSPSITYSHIYILGEREVFKINFQENKKKVMNLKVFREEQICHSDLRAVFSEFFQNYNIIAYLIYELLKGRSGILRVFKFPAYSTVNKT